MKLFLVLLLCVPSLLAASKESPEYLLPHYHHVKHELDRIFEQSNALKNGKLFARAGFQTLFLRSRGNLRIARHPKLPGYIFKTYLLNTIEKKKKRYKQLLKRVHIAAKVRKIIHENNIRHFKVATKLLYRVPNTKEYILVAQDMGLTTLEESERAWKTIITPEMLRELAIILKSGYTSMAVTQNIPYTNHGVFAIIDTEYGKRKFTLGKLNKFLSPEMRKEWRKLIK